uniref:Uncharacterized protein n=1 Tax=Oryza punctata TaxID=4537 RepID=A0A0E0L1W5_ORYPU
MEKGSSSTPSSAANTSEPAAAAATTAVPMTNFQLFGSMVPVPVASMATATAPAAVAAADNGGHGSSSASQNASGSAQGQGGNMSLSLQLRPLGSTPAPAVLVPPMAAAPMMTGPAGAAAPAPLATMAVAENASLAAVATALAAHRRNQATHRSAALHGHLRRCAEALVASRSVDADAELASIARLASADGDAVQRVAAAFAEALAQLVIRSWRGVSAALFPSDAGGDALSAWEAEFARQSFLNLCPLLHLAAVAVNEIILETTRNDKFIHIIDLGGVHHAHWVELLQALGTRRVIRPCLRLTVVHEHKHLLSQAAQILVTESERHGVPLDLHIVESSVEALKLDALGVRSDHAVVIVSTLQLHRLVGTGILNTATGQRITPTPAVGIASPLPPVTMSSKLDRLLRGFHLLSPKIIILTENEANHFVPSFMDRFASALSHYQQLFSSMEEVSLAPAFGQPAERKAVEKYLLKEEIKDIIACDHDGPRWARHEPLGRWIVRMGAAGFMLSPAITVVTAAGRVRAVAARLPGGGDERYGVTEGSGWLILNREEKPMFCVSAWRRQ